MNSPFVTFARFVCTRRNASKVKTAFIPLREVHSACIFLDAEQQDAQNCADFVSAFFSKCGISFTVYALSLSKEPRSIKGATMLTSRDISVFGIPRKGKRHPMVEGKEDLFVNLVGSGIFAADYSAICSTARMKVGRVQPGHELYDLLILNSEGYSQSEVFKQMTGILIRVK